MSKTHTKKYESLIAAMGNIMEWYNFALFMPFLHVLSKEFFPCEDTVQRDVLSFLAMSVGLFMRPFGAAILGPVGDKFGRPRAIACAGLLMAIPTILIGLLPNYSQIGIYAPISLLFLRAIQGISLGGEYTAAMVHLVEKAPAHRRAFFGCLSDVGCQVGVLLGGQALICLYSFFSLEEIYFFTWRIPFLFGVLQIPFIFCMPKTDDIPQKKRETLLISLIKYKREVGCTMAITSFSAVGFYTLLTFLPYYLVNRHLLTLKEATSCSVLSSLLITIVILVGGYLADSYSKKGFMISGIVGVSVIVYMMFLLKNTSYEQWLTLQLLYGFFIGLYFSSRAAFLAQSFPSTVRCTAVSVSLSCSQAIFGGLTPLVMDHLNKLSPSLAVIPATIVAIVAIYAVRNIIAEKHDV
ncbi:MAG: MFS transporter [Holosporaceae bacterium]|jgi:MHS family proline/betaine transporter-like MFS transporter|nr:MFS transporter [Holosporaceae bacterium]